MPREHEMKRKKNHLKPVFILLITGFFCLSLSFSCLSGSGNDDETKQSTIVMKEDSKEDGNLPISTLEGSSPHFDGGYQKVDNSREDVLRIFNWLKEELKKEGIILIGESPVKAFSQVVSGIKYTLLCEYETSNEKNKLLKADVFERSDELRIIQKITLDI
jgi:hypothetical protein